MEQFVIVVHTLDGVGYARVFGPFDSQDAAVAAVPRAVAAVPNYNAAEVVAVQELGPSPDDKSFRVD